MNNTLSTLMNLGIYILLVAAGAVIGSRKAVRSRELKWLSKLQFIALMILIVSLGVNLGAKDEIIASLGEIGIAALVITVAALAGSVLCLSLLRRFVLKLDNHGLPLGTVETPETAETAVDETPHEKGKADNSLTKWIVGAVVLGMLAGYFIIPDSIVAYCGDVINFGLYLILFLVGIDMGRQGTILGDIKAAGFKVLLVPLAVIIGTLGAAAIAGLFLPMGVKDAMAAAAGFGWYSLAPTLLAPYSLSVSAVAFLSNVMREILSIVLIPVVAHRMGFIEAVALPGAASMDTVLPVVIGSTSERITLYSFTSGVVLSLLVPIIVPFLISLPF
ncbi:MAG: lysine exporter LysO family protein [Oscillospiraceae bacterium]